MTPKKTSLQVSGVMPVVHSLLDNEKTVYGKFERVSGGELTGIFELRKVIIKPKYDKRPLETIGKAVGFGGERGQVYV